MPAQGTWEGMSIQDSNGHLHGNDGKSREKTGTRPSESLDYSSSSTLPNGLQRQRAVNFWRVIFGCRRLALASEGQ